MTKIDIFSGFLGAGKTTLIGKLLKEALSDTKVVLIENEFGEIGIDGGFLQESGIEIKEMNSGCICCSLVGDFAASLKEVLSTYSPERVLIEPSGVGKLSDVMKAVQGAMQNEEVVLNSAVVVVDAGKCKMYMKNFGEFFINQIEYAGTIILSRTGKMSEEKVSACVAMLREHNAKATIITTPWDELEGKDILETIEGAKDLEAELMKEVMARKDEHHHHHNHHHYYHYHHHHNHHHITIIIILTITIILITTIIILITTTFILLLTTTSPSKSKTTSTSDHHKILAIQLGGGKLEGIFQGVSLQVILFQKGVALGDEQNDPDRGEKLIIQLAARQGHGGKGHVDVPL